MCIMWYFSGLQNCSFRPRVFSRAIGCGARGGPARTRRCKCGLGRPPWHVLWAFSREVWQVTTGSLSAELEPGKTMENPRISFFFSTRDARTTLASSFPRSCSDGHYYACVDIAYAYVCCVCATCVRASSAYLCWNPICQLVFLLCCLLLLYVSCLYHTVPQALKLFAFCSHGSTTVAHQLLPFVTATDGASVCGGSCVLCFLWERTHNLQRVEGRCEGGRAMQTHTYVLGILHATAQPVTTAVQQHQRFKLWPL